MMPPIIQKETISKYGVTLRMARMCMPGDRSGEDGLGSGEPAAVCQDTQSTARCDCVL